MEIAGFIIGKLRETFASAKVSRELPDSTLTFPMTPPASPATPLHVAWGLRPPKVTLPDNTASHCDAPTPAVYFTGGCLEQGHATPYHPTHLALASSALCWLAQFVLVQVPTTFLLCTKYFPATCMLPPGDE